MTGDLRSSSLTTTTTTTTTTDTTTAGVVVVRQLSVVAVDESSVTLSWQHHHNSADVVYELIFWQSDELNKSAQTMKTPSQNITVFGLQPHTSYCFTCLLYTSPSPRD